jgi:hypothetical protein
MAAMLRDFVNDRFVIWETGLGQQSVHTMALTLRTPRRGKGNWGHTRKDVALVEDSSLAGEPS